MNQDTEESYDSTKDRTTASESMGSSPSGSAPTSLDPSRHIELSAAVSGVVPDGKNDYQFYYKLKNLH